MLKKIALAFAFLGMLILAGCQNFGQITPEKAIAHALAANKVVAQCYADYQKELDAFNASQIPTEKSPIAGVPIVENEPGVVPIPRE